MQIRGKRLQFYQEEESIIEYQDIEKVQAWQKKGFNRKILRVKLKNGEIYKVLDKDNPIWFKYGLLPKAAIIPECSMNSKEKSYAVKHSPWYDLSNFNISSGKTLSLYGINATQLRKDLEGGKLPPNKIGIINSKLSIDPFTAWQIYGG